MQAEAFARSVGAVFQDVVCVRWNHKPGSFADRYGSVAADLINQISFQTEQEFNMRMLMGVH